MSKFASTIAILLFIFTCPDNARADIVLADFVSLIQDVDPGSNLIQSGYTPGGGADSILFVTFSFDNAGDPSDSVTFGGTGLTKVETGANRIFYLANPGTAAGDIVLNTAAGSDGGGLEMLTFGTLTGVDTTNITALTGSTTLGSIQSGATFTGLDAGSFVLSQLAANNHIGTYSSVAGNPILAINDQDGGGYDGAVTGAAGISGDFTATVDGFTSSNAIFGISVAFAPSAVPEPSAIALLLFGFVGMASQRWRIG